MRNRCCASLSKSYRSHPTSFDWEGSKNERKRISLVHTPSLPHHSCINPAHKVAHIRFYKLGQCCCPKPRCARSVRMWAWQSTQCPARCSLEHLVRRSQASVCRLDRSHSRCLNTPLSAPFSNNHTTGWPSHMWSHMWSNVPFSLPKVQPSSFAMQPFHWKIVHLPKMSTWLLLAGNGFASAYNTHGVAERDFGGML